MSKDGLFPFDIPANKGYVDIKSTNEIYEMDGYSSLSIYTRSPEEAEKLLDTIKKLPEVEGKTFVFHVNQEDFDVVSPPLMSFENMTDTAVKAIMTAGTLIITLLLGLWTRSRQKEIGILFAIGKSKAEIIGQFLTENLLIAFLSAGAASGLTYYFAGRIGKFLIQQSDENVSDLTVSVSIPELLGVYGIGLILICIAVILSSYAVIRLKPREILSKIN